MFRASKYGLHIFGLLESSRLSLAGHLNSTETMEYHVNNLSCHVSGWMAESRTKSPQDSTDKPTSPAPSWFRSCDLTIRSFVRRLNGMPISGDRHGRTLLSSVLRGC